jgi:predicted cupin superfamily sugar epimerase
VRLLSPAGNEALTRPSPTEAKDVISALDLRPHPEGGYFREWYRSPHRVSPGDGRGERAAMTSIYFLLGEGDRSRWHVLRSDEEWTFLQGAPLDLFVVEPDASEVRRHRLDAAGSGTGEPSLVVPAGSWQAARPAGAFSLVACTVAPGFEFEDFRLLAGVAAAEARLARLAPDLAALL